MPALCQLFMSYATHWFNLLPCIDIIECFYPANRWQNAFSAQIHYTLDVLSENALTFHWRECFFFFATF